MPQTATAGPNPTSAVPRLREPVSLRRLYPAASFVGCADIRVTEATERTSDCGPGVLFATKPGHRQDGAEFACEAVSRGASALLVARPLPDLDVPQCVVADVARGFGVLCANLAGRPMRTVRTAGVTGTNGKTTVTWLVRSILQTSGSACGLLGTVEYSDGTRTEPASLTTPDAKTYWEWFTAMSAARTPYAAVELSSHALHQERVAGSELEVAVVTNVSHDHLDYHGTAAGYLASKAKVLSLVRPGGTVVLNQDDPSIDVLRPRVPAGTDVMTFALSRRAAVTADEIRMTAAGQRFMLTLRGRRLDIETRLVGVHNVANCLAAAAVADQFGLSADEIEAGLRQAVAPPGRMQRISSGEPVEVFVDYAHTPDALEKAIATVRALTAGRVIVLFGAGGDRDRSKRPSLGAAASAAEIAIVTSDNPRSEHPERIIADILSGLNGDRCEAFIEPDRAMAIGMAVAAAEPGDVVLVAGKGHETTQVLANGTIPFDDRAAAAVALRERFGSRNSGKAAA